MFAGVATTVHFDGNGFADNDLVVFLPSGQLNCDTASEKSNGAAAGEIHDGSVSITVSGAVYYKICIFHPTITKTKPNSDADFSLSATQLNVVPAPPPPSAPPHPPEPPPEQLALASASSPALPIGLGVGLTAFFLLLFGVACVFYRRSMRFVRNELLLKSHKFDIEMNVFMKDSEEPVELRGLLRGILTVGVNTLDFTDTKFVSELRSLITSQDAALGFIHYMKVEPSVVHIGLSQGLEAIRNEFERYTGEFADEVRSHLHFSPGATHLTRPRHDVAPRVISPPFCAGARVHPLRPL